MITGSVSSGQYMEDGQNTEVVYLGFIVSSEHSTICVIPGYLNLMMWVDSFLGFNVHHVMKAVRYVVGMFAECRR